MKMIPTWPRIALTLYIYIYIYMYAHTETHTKGVMDKFSTFQIINFARVSDFVYCATN